MKIICTTMHTLQQSPTSVLAQLFSPPFPLYDDLEEIHRFPHEYVSEDAFLQIIDCLRSGEWVPCRTTDQREELIRAVAVLSIEDLPDIPLAADHSVLIAEGGTGLYYQHAVATENMKDLRRKMNDREERSIKYNGKRVEVAKAKKAFDAAEDSYNKSKSVSDQYRNAADELIRKKEESENRQKRLIDNLEKARKDFEELEEKLRPLTEENENKQREARKAKFSHVQQRELSDAAEEIAKAAEQPQPNGADPIKDETLEAAAAQAREVTEAAKKISDEKAAIAARSHVDYEEAARSMGPFAVALQVAVQESEDFAASQASEQGNNNTSVVSQEQIDERVKLADEAEEGTRPLKEARDQLRKAFDDVSQVCDSLKPKSPDEEDSESRKQQELLEEKIFIEEPHPQSIVPAGAIRIIPRQVRKLGLKGYQIRGEFRGDIDVFPPAASQVPQAQSFFGAGAVGGGGGGGGVGAVGSPRGFGGFGGNAAIRKGGFGHRTIGAPASKSHRTGSNDARSQPQQQPPLATTTTTNNINNNNYHSNPNYNNSDLASTNQAGGNGGAIVPFSGVRGLAFCDSTTVIMEKELERLDYLMMLAYESPNGGDFFRQKKPVGALQELIDSCVL